MDQMDKLLSQFLGKGRPSTPPGALTDEEVRLFAENRLEGERLERVLERLAQSPQDQALVAAVRGRLAEVSEAQAERVQDSLIDQAGLPPARRSGSGACPHCGGAITPFKKSPDRQKLTIGLWATLCIAGFALSFVFPRYFLQCLTIAALAGFKWITDQRALKTQILVYRALDEPFKAPKRGNLQRDDARL